MTLSNGPIQVETDAAGWGFREGSRLVDGLTWISGLPDEIRTIMHLEALGQALAAAADETGQLIDFRIDEFYRGPLSDELRSDDDPDGWRLQYDRYSAMTLTHALFHLSEAGLLARRGNGDSVDYRLCLPASG